MPDNREQRRRCHGRPDIAGEFRNFLILSRLPSNFGILESTRRLGKSEAQQGGPGDLIRQPLATTFPFRERPGTALLTAKCYDG